MLKRAYPLPGLTQLAAFEAAARHSSFKEAASELEVTSSAISHQIRALEDNLSIHLFLRQGRKVELTEAGRALFRELESSFQGIGDVCEKIRAQGSELTVRFGVSHNAGHLWLDPRSPNFLADHEEYRVSVAKCDLSALETGEIQLALYYGEPPVGRYKVELLFEDEVIPVASPDYAKRYAVNSLPALARFPLLKLDVSDPAPLNWSEWFTALGYLGELKYTEKSNNYLKAIEVARSGTAAILGWRHLLQAELARGELMPLTAFSLPAQKPFYLVSTPEASLNEASKAMRSWLLDRDAQNALNF